jgi:hypothetical protein
MATCSHCGVETELYDGGVPLCVKCSTSREVKRKPPLQADQIRTALVNQIVQATARVSAANQKFSDVIGHYPSGLPQPDGVQRIKSASNELTVARKEMMKAHKRLNDFIEDGIVPEDLKRSG